MTTYMLTQDGQPKASIVIARNPTRAAIFGAKELQYHVKKISGAVLPIISDDPSAIAAASTSGPLILIGESEVTRRYGLTGDDFQAQEYIVACPDSDTIVLMGRDAEPKRSNNVVFPERTEGKFGKACRFNGRNTFINIPSREFRFSDEMGSLGAWVFLPIDPDPSRPVISKTILRIETQIPKWTYHIISHEQGQHPINGYVNAIGYSTYDGSVDAAGVGHAYHIYTDTLLGGCWHYVFASFNTNMDDKMRLFVDGKESYQSPSPYRPTACSTSEFAIGLGGYSLAGASVTGIFEGLIDEVKISRNLKMPDLAVASCPDEASDILLLDFDEAGGDYLINRVSGEPITAMPGHWDTRGTLDAVYDFLEDSCGVRWYAPTDIGLVCPRISVLEVNCVPHRRRPLMEYRWAAPGSGSWHLESAAQPISAEERDLWMLRMRMGGENRAFGSGVPGVGVKTLANTLKLLNEHPEFFSRRADGTTKFWKHADTNELVPVQFCYTNQDLISMLIQDVCDWLEGKTPQLSEYTNLHSYSLVPTDRGDWCECRSCSELRRRTIDLFSNDLASWYIHSFTREVAAGVADKVRERGLTWQAGKRLEQLAYSDYAHFPRWATETEPEIEWTDLTIEPSTFVWLCLHPRQYWQSATMENDRKILHDWRSQVSSDCLGLYLYYQYPAALTETLAQNSFRCFPGFFARKAVTSMSVPDVYSGMKSLHVETSCDLVSFMMDQLELYVTFKLADNPHANDPRQGGEDLIDKFFEGFYGPAAAPMRALYHSIEQVYTSPDSYAPFGVNPAFTEDLAWGKQGLGTKERMAGYLKLMALSRAMILDTDSEKKTVYWKRLQMFDKGVWDYMVDGYRHWNANPWPPMQLEVWFNSQQPLIGMPHRHLEEDLRRAKMPPFFSAHELEVNLPQRELPEEIWQRLLGDKLRSLSSVLSPIAMMNDKLEAAIKGGAPVLLVPLEDELLNEVAMWMTSEPANPDPQPIVLRVPAFQLRLVWELSAGTGARMLLWSDSGKKPGSYSLLE
jgi:hypothetical protein